MAETNWINRLLGFLRLTHERESNEVIHEVIEKSVVFRGTNLWILIFAILVASVGLNMNSTAVIIGAMLISPLMGPINGVGYSVATYNYSLFKKSLANFGFASGAALVTSTLYFLLTPIHTEHSEILARTSPTIYDVLIALFGGLAGIIAISSKNKGNVIPGVAIATALMPPLCTAGYGLSIGNLVYFFGALYLFVINSVFIALASMLVTQILKLPRKSHLLTREIKNKNLAIGIVIAITVIPSFYLGYTLVVKEKFMEKAEGYVKDVSQWEGNYLLSNTIDGDKRTIHLVYAGNEFDEKTVERLKQKAHDLGMTDLQLTVEQGLKIEDFKVDDTRLDIQAKELERLKSALVFKERSLDSLRHVPDLGKNILDEISAIYPQIIACSYSESEHYVDSLEHAAPVAVVILETTDDLEEKDIKKVRDWLIRRIGNQHLILKF